MVMNLVEHQKEKITALIDTLKDQDGLKRQHARLSLTAIGEEAVPDLIQTLKSDYASARWEAAKALEDIASPTAAPVLVTTLEDDDVGVRWAAMEALIRIGRPAIRYLLEGLVRDISSVWLREGAHHILHMLKDRNLLTQPEIHLFQVLSDPTQEALVPWAAEAALESLEGPKSL